ncbi:MAG: acyl-CoA reductase [Bacteroidales bacterium]|nr:acyl-CoA reductase [Bacteroidales bacterium]
MDLNERIKSFAELGETLRQILSDGYAGNGRDRSLHINNIINNQHLTNPWFTPANVRSALNAIADKLTEENLIHWTNSYPQLKEKTKPVSAGVIMAGNIPLVGFHDFLSVLITGNKLIAKTSSKDSELLIYISKLLCELNPEFGNKIVFTDEPLKGFDVVIATGSDNSSRYFEYYFGKYPNIIRKNRNSIAILEGDEPDKQLEALGTDIFSYFGLGCRNVSKIYLPSGYDLSIFTNRWKSFSDFISHQKYANNYDFNKAVYIVNKEKFFDTGFLLMKEENKLSSPVSVLHYEYYNSLNDVIKQTELMKENIQCIVGKHHIQFGQAQSPDLWDYADGTDTIEFLLKKNYAGIL